VRVTSKKKIEENCGFGEFRDCEKNEGGKRKNKEMDVMLAVARGDGVVVW
jgi:hypothetical protein